MNVTKIVRQYLFSHGYDGLYSQIECACTLDDLMPCGECRWDCEAGYISDCDCGEHDFHIGYQKAWKDPQIDLKEKKD